MSRFPSLADLKYPFFREDEAETFTESDVTVTADGPQVAGGSVVLDEGATDNAALTSGAAGWGETTDKSGVFLTFDVVGVSIDGAIMTDAGNLATTAYLIDSGGGVLDTGAIDGAGGFSLGPVDVSTSEEYRVLTDSNGNTYDSQHDSDSSLPVDVGAVASVTEGLNRLGNRVSYPIQIQDISVTEHPLSGSATIEWPEPPEIYRWDAANLNTTPDGGSVQVDIQESADGGSSWTTIATNVGRGQQITAEPTNRCRYMVHFERADVAQKPALDSIYRRWVA